MIELIMLLSRNRNVLRYGKDQRVLLLSIYMKSARGLFGLYLSNHQLNFGYSKLMILILRRKRFLKQKADLWQKKQNLKKTNFNQNLSVILSIAMIFFICFHWVQQYEKQKKAICYVLLRSNEHIFFKIVKLLCTFFHEKFPTEKTQ